MSLTREKYDLALHSLYECANNCDVAYVGSKNSKCNREFYILDELIEEHFDNPPLKFEELEEGMWVWDKDFNRFGEWLKILIVKINDHDEKIIKAVCVGTNEIMIRSYKKDRFYRKQVEE